MSRPSAEAVWDIIAKHSACVCDPVVYGNIPCLRHHQEAAEVWLAAQGVTCTQVIGTEQVGGRRFGHGDWIYDFLPNLVTGSPVRGWYGIPKTLIYSNFKWRLGPRGGAHSTVEACLLSGGFYQ
jgi:hypothetical protein